MSYLLLVLYYYFDCFETFILFSNLIVSNSFMRDLYTFDMHRVYSYSKFFEESLREDSPELMSFFESQFINTMTFSIDWLYTLYTRAFDINCARVVWDMFFMFGPLFAIRLGVTILVTLKKEMMTEYMNEGFNFVRVRTGKIKISEIITKTLKSKMDYNSFTMKIEKFYEAEASKPKPAPRQQTKSMHPAKAEEIKIVVKNLDPQEPPQEIQSDLWKTAQSNISVVMIPDMRPKVDSFQG